MSTRERRAAVRIWLDRRALAARNLTVADMEAALTRNNVELPAAAISDAPAGLRTSRLLYFGLLGRW